MTETTYKATIQERGNGFCDVGDYVSGNDGELYRVVRFVGRIQTGQSGSGAPNYIHAEVEPADWSKLSDTEAGDIICTCSIEEEN